MVRRWLGGAGGGWSSGLALPPAPPTIHTSNRSAGPDPASPPSVPAYHPRLEWLLLRECGEVLHGGAVQHNDLGACHGGWVHDLLRGDEHAMLVHHTAAPLQLTVQLRQAGGGEI